MNRTATAWLGEGERSIAMAWLGTAPLRQSVDGLYIATAQLGEEKQSKGIA